MEMGESSQTEVAHSFGKYALIEKLGEGYLGSVYRGFDQDLGRAVVVRILCDAIKWDEKLEMNFYRECRSVASLQHPNIAAFFEACKDGQRHLVVMESLGSGNLESLVARKSAIPVEAKLSIMIQVADGLAYAHKNGILHRNLSPGKIHLTADGSVKIRDFGIAHVLMKHLPHPFVRWGDPIYLSPEQIQQRDCNEQSDIFSTGVIFYEFLTSYHPFHDRNSNKVLDNILLETEIPTFDQFPDVPPGIWPILKTCLARDPNDRYRSMDELAGACRELLRDLAEDTRFMLAELHTALAPLKKAAEQPDAPESTIRFLQDIQKLLQGDAEADYASLDRLMTILIEQYPSIQTGADELRAMDAVRLQVAQVEADDKMVTKDPSQTSEQTAKSCDSSTPVQPSIKDATPDGPPKDIGSLSTQQIPSGGTVAPETNDERPEMNFEEIEGTSFPFQYAQAIPISEQEAITSCDATPNDVMDPLLKPAQQDMKVETKQPRISCDALMRRTPIINKLRYRSAVMLLSVLLIAVAVYIILGTNAAASFRNAWKNHVPISSATAREASGHPFSFLNENKSRQGILKGFQEASDPNTARILLQEARALAAENRFEESKVLVGRILEIDPTNQEAVTALIEIDAASAAPKADRRSASQQPSQEKLAQVSSLIDSGMLQIAKVELEKLEKTHPKSDKVIALRKRWQAKGSKEIQERTRQEEQEKKKALEDKEAQRYRRLAELFAQGNYSEASNTLNMWLAENPGSIQAQKFNAVITEIQRSLGICASALSENRYQDALGALSSVERLNPGDPSLAEMRRKIESRMAAATTTLTVRRLGGKGTLLFDGRPMGNDGEIENEIIGIGSHTLAVENAGKVFASWKQEFLEGQKAVFVYDLAKQNLRPMAEADHELLSQRRAMEQVHVFVVEHKHGAFRGSCRGELMDNYFEVVYKPFSGSHGFQIPSKILKISVDGKSLNLIYVLDNQNFKSFKFQNEQEAEKFKLTWDEIRAIEP